IQSFIFKPWILNIDNQFVVRDMERFHLFIPAYFFHHILDKHIFMEAFKWEDISNIRIIEEIQSSKTVDLTSLYEENDVSHFARVRSINLYEVDQILHEKIRKSNQTKLDINENHKARYLKYFE